MYNFGYIRRRLVSALLCGVTAACALGSGVSAEKCGIPASICGLEIKQAERVERVELIPGGQPFGIKLRTDGVMVVSVNAGSPAEKSGIKPGDMITEVNGEAVGTNSDIAEAVQKSPECCAVILKRGSAEKQLKITPEEVSGSLRLGAWVRDSAAGIGTLTFADPQTGKFAGLGHPVSDVTTGELMPLSSGEATGAEIYSTIKGRNGETGELCGELCENVIGSIDCNTPVGVFGTVCGEVSGETLPMAFREEVQRGPATVLATINGSAPEEYSIEIEKINLYAASGTKSMVIHVTDERLLDAAGGIVRGMSGSPIIQNGMIAGAVTHVFVNDPARGYAVFAETMVEEMRGET